VWSPMTTLDPTAAEDERAPLAATKLWHPFADMARVHEHELVIDRGEGVWLWDEDGRRYLDASAGLWHTNVGHGRAEIRDAVNAQLERLATHHIFGDYATRPALELAERLSALAPIPDARVFFGSGGGDAIETAVKLARAYWARVGQPERTHIVSRTGGYHGTHGIGTSISGLPFNRQDFGPLVPHTSVVAHDSADALREEIARVGAERVAAFVFEPVIGSGGLLLPPEGYIEEIAAICNEHDVLLIADVVVSGFGRLGTWYGVERWGLVPDMIVFAKGVTSGYLPLGGVIVSPRLAEPFWREPGSATFRSGLTYSGHATCCAAALANLDIMEREDLLARSRALEVELERELRALEDHALVQSVSAGIGFLGALDFRDDLLERYPTLTVDALAVVRAAGVLTRPLPKGLAVSPPLTASAEDVALVGLGLRRALDHLEGLLEEDEDVLPLSQAAMADLNADLAPVAA
jgi:putrescine---pyruvate transaminase